MTTNQEVGGSNPPGRNPMPKKNKAVLICGGSGLIAQHLARRLRAKSYNVSFFTRSLSISRGQYFHWEPKNAWLNPDVLRSVDVIINLSGSSIAKGPWSKKRKAEIFNSRIQSTRLLYKKLAELKHKPSLFINASAIGFYPSDRDELMTEESPAGEGFLSHLAWSWEKEAVQIAELGIRTVIFRIALVLSNEGGLLPKMKRAFALCAGSVLGSGKQYMSWIHIDDLCSLFLEAIQNKKWQGVYNAVSPNPVSNQEFTLTLSKLLRRPLLVPRIPAVVLKLFLGEMSTLVLDGSRVSAEKVIKSRFRFRYPHLGNSLSSLLYSPPSIERKGVK